MREVSAAVRREGDFLRIRALADPLLLFPALLCFFV
jgi:hypothetical protein